MRPEGDTDTMRPGITFTCLVCSLVSFSAVHAQPPADNILTNPDLEQSADGAPTAWTFSSRQGEPESAWEQRDAGHCVRITVHDTNEDGSWNQDNIPTAPGARIYRLSAIIKTQLESCTARVCPVYLSDGKWLGAQYGAITVAGDTEWTRHVALIRAPEGTTKMRVRLWVNFEFTGTGTAWFDDVELTPVADIQNIPPIRYVSEAAMPPVSRKDEERGFVVFRRNTLDIAMPGTVPSPEDIDRPLAAFAAPGQHQPVSFCVRALEDLKSFSAKPSDLSAGPNAKIPAAAVSVRSVRDLERMVHRGMIDTIVKPTFLEDRDEVDIPAGTTAWFWVIIEVPAGAPAGLYEGRIGLSIGDAGVGNVPVRLEVLPIRLAEPEGVAIGFYDRPAPPPHTRALSLERYREMRRRGMTTVGLVASTRVERDGDRPGVVWDEENVLGEAMAAYKEAGFTEPIVWLMGGVERSFCIKEFGPLDSEAFERAYRDIIEQIQAKAAAEGWPEIVYQPIDEPPHQEQRMRIAVRCLQILKSVSGVRTEEDGNLVPGTDDFEAMYAHLDVVCCNFRRQVEQQKRGTWPTEMRQRCERDGKLLWTYNIDTTGYHPEAMRFGMCFGREACGSKGMIEWIYQSVRADDDPYTVDPTRQRLKFYFWFPPYGDERGGPSIGLEGATEGATDARYLATFEAAVRAAKASGNREKARMAEQAMAEYEQQLSRMNYTAMRTELPYQGDWTVPKHFDENGYPLVGGHFKIPNGWAFDDYDRTRRLLADWISRLNR